MLKIEIFLLVFTAQHADLIIHSYLYETQNKPCLIFINSKIDVANLTRKLGQVINTFLKKLSSLFIF